MCEINTGIKFKPFNIISLDGSCSFHTCGVMTTLCSHLVEILKNVVTYRGPNLLAACLNISRKRSDSTWALPASSSSLKKKKFDASCSWIKVLRFIFSMWLNNFHAPMINGHLCYKESSLLHGFQQGWPHYFRSLISYRLPVTLFKRCKYYFYYLIKVMQPIVFDCANEGLSFSNV